MDLYFNGEHLKFPSEIQEARAATQTKTALTAVSVKDGGGYADCDDNGWAIEGISVQADLQTEDGSEVNVTPASFDDGDITYTLELSNFGFDLPADSTIDGIEVTIKRRSLGGADGKDYHLQLTKSAGTPVVSSDDNADTTTIWPDSVTAAVYGGVDNKWNTTWTEVEIESSGFGLVFAAQAVGANADIWVDQIEVTVHYTLPAATTTLSTGTNPGNSTVAPGGSITSVNGFTLTTSAETDAITAVIVNLSTNSGVGTLTITNGADSVLGSIGGGTGSGIITGSNPITISSTDATTGGTAFKVKVTPLLHANMPVPDGGEYAITGIVTDWTGSNTKAGQATDTSDTVTIDNDSPAGTTGASATPGDTTVDVGWTPSGDGDFQQVYIYCKTSSMISGEAPTEGTDPSVDETPCDGTARMKYKGTTSPQTISSLTNDTLYYFRIYARDTNGNFTAYASTQEVSATPVAAGLSTAIEIRAQNYTDTILDITFPEGAPETTVSQPYNNVDGSGSPQAFGSPGTPVVTLYNGNASALIIWYNITTFANSIVSSENYLINTKEAACVNETAITNAVVFDTDTSTGITIASGAGNEKDVYLKINLSASAGKSGDSILTILGETP